MIQSPEVRYGLGQFGNWQIPQAFIDRMMYDAAMATQTHNTLRPRQQINENTRINQRTAAMPLKQDVLNYYFRQPKEGMYAAYGGVNEYLDKMNQKYQGEGYTNRYTQPLVQQKQQFREQQKGNFVPKRTVTVSGQTTNNQPAINRQQILNNEQRWRKEEKVQKKNMANDLLKFKRLGENKVESNLPVAVTRKPMQV